MFWLSRAALVLAVSIGYAGTLAAQTLSFSRQDHASHAGARAVVSADFNRDGRPDLAHANTGRNTVTILLGGDGGSLSETFDIPVGAGPFDLTTGDYNEDGIADLAVARFRRDRGQPDAGGRAPHQRGHRHAAHAGD